MSSFGTIAKEIILTPCKSIYVFECFMFQQKGKIDTYDLRLWG